MIICISAGHGEGENGAVANGLIEADLTLDIAERVQTKLSTFEADVRLVPRRVDLADRTRYANTLNADLYLSIHCNAGSGTGFESYIHPAAGERTQELQRIIHGTIMGYLEQQGVKDRGKKTANFQVLRETTMPAVLLECLFIDSDADAALLKSDAFLNGLANEIAYAMVVALGLKRKPVVPDCNTCEFKELLTKMMGKVADMKGDMEKIGGLMKQIAKILDKY